MANSSEFGFCDITVTAMGRTFERILEIEYDIEVEKKHIYGRGCKPKGIQRSNQKPTGKITLGQSELEAMIAVAPEGKIGNLEMDIQIHYTKKDGSALVKDRIVGAEFTKAPKGMKQGDTDMNVTLDFIAMDILYNI